ncbi:hypothetical protein L7F22_065442 [Adiantum nelumboides]|nr:hypothetical protein [Adiantum nelumboides]
MPYAMPPMGSMQCLLMHLLVLPMLFGPPPICSIPNVATIVGEHAVKKPTPGKLRYEESTQVTSAKPPHKNIRSQNQSAKDSSNDGEGTAPKQGRTVKAKAKVKEADEDYADKVMWKDFWVEHLIHIRGGMDDEFSRMPKQGVDLWGKVATKLASMFADCDKDG